MSSQLDRQYQTGNAESRANMVNTAHANRSAMPDNTKRAFFKKQQEFQVHIYTRASIIVKAMLIINVVYEQRVFVASKTMPMVTVSRRRNLSTL